MKKKQTKAQQRTTELLRKDLNNGEIDSEVLEADLHSNFTKDEVQAFKDFMNTLDSDA